MKQNLREVNIIFQRPQHANKTYEVIPLGRKYDRYVSREQWLGYLLPLEKSSASLGKGWIGPWWPMELNYVL